MNDDTTTETRPLNGIRVLELCHVVMGPSCGMVLADLGAEVIKIEPTPDGEPTRRMKGIAQGLFHYFNRNKKSLGVDLKTEKGVALVKRALADVDILIENFGPGVMERFGLGYEDCKAVNPGLIYCALKGFMPGPYENRNSLDNLVQMMGGISYMTGPPGQPTRAGVSITDIIGGTYGVIGIMAALRERDQTGRGQKVMATLFEGAAFLTGQHMALSAVTQQPVEPWPVSENPWAIYDLFDVSAEADGADGGQIGIGIINDQHWQRFCAAMGLDDLLADDRLAHDAGRKQHRDEVVTAIRAAVAARTLAEVTAICDDARVPFAPVNRPEQLFDDPHLNQAGALLETVLPDGRTTKLPKLPLQMDGKSFGLYREPPKVGEGGTEFLLSVGLSEGEINDLAAEGVIKKD